IYFSFGHDEELGGLKGAKVVADELSRRGMRAKFVIDEGNSIGDPGPVEGYDKAAYIATGEKGAVTLLLSVDQKGGHSSTPLPETAIDILAGALHAINQNPYPTRLPQSIKDYVDRRGPRMGFMNRLVGSNRWLFEPIIEDLFTRNHESNAWVRSTMVPTIIRGGTSTTSIPYHAEARIHVNLLPGDTADDLEAHVREVINDDRVKISRPDGIIMTPPISDVNGEGFKVIERSIMEVFGDIPVTPSQLSGGTDSRYFTQLSDQVYRFVPAELKGEAHGVNERIPEAGFYKAIRYYIQLIRNGSQEN
ncbi:MAG: M20/M25/M40 family metallo-hydrolase, partial [Cyclobacteriaceae bacterium]